MMSEMEIREGEAKADALQLEGEIDVIKYLRQLSHPTVISTLSSW
jgi:hypothetical protein